MVNSRAVSTVCILKQVLAASSRQRAACNQYRPALLLQSLRFQMHSFFAEVPMQTLARLTLICVLLATVSSITGCGYHNDKEKYYLVAVNIQLPYWQAAASGIRRAAHEMQVQSQFSGPDTYDTPAGVQAFRSAAAPKPAGITISPPPSKHLPPATDKTIW